MIPKASGIYRIRNLLTGRIYIGSAVNMHKRFGIHLHQLRNNKHHSRKLQRAWNKGGEDVFVFEVIEFVPVKERLLEREQFWLDLTRASEVGYNCTPVAGSTLGRRFTKETLAKLSKSARTRPPVTPEARAKMSISGRGRVRSPEHQARLAAANKARGAKATAERIQREAEARSLREQLRLVPPTPNRVCASCGKDFFAKQKDIERGGGKFCCASCYHGSRFKPLFTRTCRKCGGKFSFPREHDFRWCNNCRGAEQGIEWDEREGMAA